MKRESLLIVIALVAGCSKSDEKSESQGGDASDTWSVSKIVDGDTIWVTDESGDEVKVRLIGIDTPESGRCGFDEATAELESLISGSSIELVEGGIDDVDKFGRLLRYVEVDGNDVGLAMIKSGWAIARYDSRDGYGEHLQEESYVEADESSENKCPDSAWFSE